ncbi:MAG TPA: phytoene/squalene synthase family protein [Dyella sp.]|uniref:phytoene/squalene synthase family protein n=1 Tax=Dyella sp. TaxID=1869338 RepID=UPI002CBE5DB9|nr:phytoene/squalene synthase family protein [Dyella sp.]HUB91196.1 phytoene/squalene synthase family protein [Dyella sp.]
MIESHNATAGTGRGEADTYQDAILPKVSRTFALTIPQLPPELRRAVANAYLLCRIADTIEDEPVFSAEQKRAFENAFVDAVTGDVDPQEVADEVAPLLSSSTLDAERDLMKQLPLVLEVTRSLSLPQQASIVKCLRIMSHGMHDFQRKAGLHGLPTLHDLDRYCYCVAGVVGEMLTELFVDFEPLLAPHRNTMLRLAVSFGQGLQMVNILKDQWEDRARGACWLPQDMFARHGVKLASLQAGKQNAGYAATMSELVGVAHAHLRQALEYTLLIPTKHAGIRRFCLWATGMAVLTLRKLQQNLDFSAGTQVKISRKDVARTILMTRLLCKSNAGLRWLFSVTARGLPLTPLATEWSEPSTPARTWPKRSIPHIADAAAWRESADVEEARHR